MRALEFDRLMALLLRIFSRSATITRSSVSCIKAITDLVPMLSAPGGHIQYSGNSFSLGATTGLESQRLQTLG